MRGGSVDIANERLRAFVRAHGGRPWSGSELAELDRLRCAFTQAEREIRPSISLGTKVVRHRRARQFPSLSGD